MVDALSALVTGMHQDSERMNATSQNIANATTSGYKGLIPVTRGFDDVVQNLSNSQSQGGNFTALNTASGMLQHTNNPFDFAIEGAGLFEIATDQGLLYTRNGSFKVNIDGKLVTQEGYAVQSQTGDIVLKGKEPPTLSIDGNLMEGSSIAGKFRLVEVGTSAVVQPVGNGMYKISNQDSIVPAAVTSGYSVRQAYLESSNVQSTQEMVRMIETLRHFEMSQKVIHGYDEMLETSIRKLGDI